MPGTLFVNGNGLGLLCCNFDGPCQFLAPSTQGAQTKLRLLRLALQRTLLLARLCQCALSLNDPVIQLGVALLGVGQLHVKFFKTPFSGDLALLQVLHLLIKLCHIGLNLLTARAGLLGQLA